MTCASPLTNPTQSLPKGILQSWTWFWRRQRRRPTRKLCLVPLPDTPQPLCFAAATSLLPSYTSLMGTPPVPVESKQVGILVLDNDAQGAGAVRQILDSEGWRVRIVQDTHLLLAELKTGEWSL